MIEGYFRDDAPRVTLSLSGESGEENVEFIVDTGFNGTLALPSFVMDSLGATLQGVRLVELADGTERRSPFFTVAVDWEGEKRVIRATLLDGEPLIGVAFLREYHLHIEVTEGGQVFAEPL